MRHHSHVGVMEGPAFQQVHFAHSTFLGRCSEDDNLENGERDNWRIGLVEQLPYSN